MTSVGNDSKQLIVWFVNLLFSLFSLCFCGCRRWSSGWSPLAFGFLCSRPSRGPPPRSQLTFLWSWNRLFWRGTCTPSHWDRWHWWSSLSCILNLLRRACCPYPQLRNRILSGCLKSLFLAFCPGWIKGIICSQNC